MFEHSTSHILLIEDDQPDVDLIQHILANAEPAVILDVARDGEEALSILQTWDAGVPLPDLILLSLKLSESSWFEVLKALKEHPRFRKIPLAVLSPSDNPHDILKAYSLGANSYLLKSADPDQFSQAVRLIHRYWCELNVRPQ
ncbi:MAG TPA: response regulator [Anaerolineales bacterium]|jgi:CheY-like chemotaxis protein